MENYLRQLVAMPTLTDDKVATIAGLDFLQSFFEARGLHVVRIVSEGHGSLVATTKEGDKAPRVMLGAHLDVVPGEAELFTLREQDGKYFGRGVFDMKFALAAYMTVLDTLGDELTNYSLGIMITTDEENGGQYGVNTLIEQGYRPGVCILPDGAGNWDIETLAKGFIFGHIDVVGKNAHGSRPWDGDSATYKLIDVLQEIKQLFAEQKLNTNTLNISMVEGGKALNQIPASAHATLDIRLTTVEDYTRLTAQLHAICAKYRGCSYRESFNGKPCVTDLQHPLVKAFTESITHITGHVPTGTLSVGGSDARYFAEVGVPCILARPSGGAQHADNEWIDKQGCLLFPEVVLRYLQVVAKR